MKVGFTGTRDGMTQHQSKTFYAFICELPTFTEFHHGDCVGADDDAAEIVNNIRNDSDMEARGFIIVCHPPVDQSLRACNSHADKTLEPKTHFARNRDIVDQTDVLIVCPKQMEHQKYGGTWYTHDYAIKKGKKVIVLWPKGATP